MITKYYCCNQEENPCEKKEQCERFINATENPSATLYKCACTEENEWILFIKSKEEEK